ncbi:unnamed protein product [Ilex paraguariensis]|uniref:Uncharacterized protein n=1 Tax=Ilex paraguariensis TaxID=185542 RepID=A0ABC8S7E7_9AQUA
MVSIPAKYQGNEGFRRSHPVLLVVAGDETNKLSLDQKRCHLGGCGRDGSMEFQSGYAISSPTARQFYSLSSSFYVQALRFQSAVLMVRCNHRILAPGLEMQLYKIYRGMITAASIHPSMLVSNCISTTTVYSSFILNQQSSSPRHLFTLYVVKRIKNNASGLLIQLATLLLPQKERLTCHFVLVQLIFDSFISRGLQDVHSGVNSLERLLVYTPSVYLIKLELLPSIKVELNESDPITRSGSYLHSQDKE